MRTGGKGNDILMIVIPGGVLVFFILWLFGGPGEFFKWLNTMIGDAVSYASSLF